MTFTADDREALKRLLLRRSVRIGDFVLASGQRSRFYVDARLTTCHSAAMPLIGRACLDRIAARGWQPQAVGGLTMGADPVAFAIARESLAAGLSLDAFVIRKEQKAHGRGRSIEGIETTQGVPVVIIDDVCSTGGSTATAIERARAEGMVVLGAVCLVDREMGAAGRLQDDHCCALESVFRVSELLIEAEIRE
ncbi:MAG: orotate phosphoribosyltransferase [Bryobacteraceae bacterium]